jgi:hypothetical protein
MLDSTDFIVFSLLVGHAFNAIYYIYTVLLTVASSGIFDGGINVIRKDWT